MLFNLLQWCVRYAKATEAHVSQCFLQFSEKAGICTIFKTLIWEQIGHLLTDHFNQLRLRYMVMNQSSDALNIPCVEREKKNINFWRNDITVYFELLVHWPSSVLSGCSAWLSSLYLVQVEQVQEHSDAQSHSFWGAQVKNSYWT